VRFPLSRLHCYQDLTLSGGRQLPHGAATGQGRSDSIFSGRPAWLRDGNIAITPATVTKFNTWYQVNEAITVAGKDLSEWVRWARIRVR